MRRFSPAEPVSVWSEKDVAAGKTVDALVAILRTGGCWWSRKSGCLMCGYNAGSANGISAQDLVAQFGRALERHEGQPFIKIYTSGSFLDPGEVAPEARDAILEMAGGRAERVLVESRPEFVVDVTLAEALDRVGSLEVAIGLETADDAVRARCVNKGFMFRDFERACATAGEAGADVRAYLLLKPPYMTEGRAIEDAVASVGKVAGMCRTVSVNPMNIQRGTAVEALWRKSLYRPPWLWSLLSVLERGSELTEARLMSSPSGGGTRRGAHNCGKCDDAILRAVAGFSLSGEIADLRMPACECRSRWLDSLDIEPFMGTAGNLQRLCDPQ